MNLEELKNKKTELESQLRILQSNICEYEYNQKKEQYGNDFCCDKCRFDCIEYPGDYHTTCLKYNCVLCNDNCDEYLPENELSQYIRSHNKYSWNSIWNSIAKVLDYDDLDDLLEKGTESDFEKAIRIYDIARGKN